MNLGPINLQGVDFALKTAGRDGDFAGMRRLAYRGMSLSKKGYEAAQTPEGEEHFLARLWHYYDVAEGAETRLGAESEARRQSNLETTEREDY